MDSSSKWSPAFRAAQRPLSAGYSGRQPSRELSFKHDSVGRLSPEDGRPHIPAVLDNKTPAAKLDCGDSTGKKSAERVLSGSPPRVRLPNSVSIKAEAAALHKQATAFRRNRAVLPVTRDGAETSNGFFVLPQAGPHGGAATEFYKTGARSIACDVRSGLASVEPSLQKVERVEEPFPAGGRSGPLRYRPPPLNLAKPLPAGWSAAANQQRSRPMTGRSTIASDLSAQSSPRPFQDSAAATPYSLAMANTYDPRTAPTAR
eukprot:gnl/TRDRNA2_/TRDRNA2_92397_c0_seq1.p1 gnl/TRDRNA2_/TRDRNA2_92397_c0~~gnl/TRDRNA2_/TRDRNA2_92397_c0_seq1.p1  ORF type:complete len:260 (-),score=31.25 gnl/TRDRNA2_/TRDRNA2_92397_c0_seq1:76-855(-)